MLRFGRLLLMLAVPALQATEPPATNDANSGWISVAQVQTNLALPYRETTISGLVLSNGTHALSFNSGRRNASLDGTTFWLHHPLTNDMQEITRADYEFVLRPLLVATAAPPSALPIMLDAGHGGEDSGARNAQGTLLEKQLALDLTQQVAGELTAAGYPPILTRTGDVTVTLGERVRMAAAQKAQLFVSIHANSSPSNLFATGAETYLLPVAGFNGVSENGHGPTNACPGNRFDTANTQLGFYLHRRYAPLTEMDRGLKRKRLYVLKEAPCPAALIECGFLTNSNDTRHLAESGYRQRLATAIAAGILDYVHYSSGTPPPPLPATPPAPPASAPTSLTGTNAAPTATTPATPFSTNGTTNNT